MQRWPTHTDKESRIFSPPGYRPELNPDELLNHDVKANAVGRRRAANRRDMMADVHGYLRSTQKQPAIVQSYFHAPSVRYAME